MRTGEWWEGNLLVYGNRCFIIPNEEMIESEADSQFYWRLIAHHHEVDPETVGQCSGVLDINGKLIFEKDVVKIPDDYEVYGQIAGEKYEVYFGFGGFRLKPKRHPKARGFWLENDRDVEVVGNVVDNPEVLSDDICGTKKN